MGKRKKVLHYLCVSCAVEDIFSARNVKLKNSKMGIETILFGVVWSLIAVVLISVLVAYVIRGVGKEVTLPEFPQEQKDPSVEYATNERGTTLTGTKRTTKRTRESAEAEERKKRRTSTMAYTPPEAALSSTPHPANGGSLHSESDYSDYKTANESHTDRSSSDDDSNDVHTYISPELIKIEKQTMTDHFKDTLLKQLEPWMRENSTMRRQMPVNELTSEINPRVKILADLVATYSPELKMSKREQKNLENETLEFLEFTYDTYMSETTPRGVV